MVSSLQPGSESLHKTPDNLQSPHPWLCPRGMGADMEEAERRRLILGHWNGGVTGTLGVVLYLQCKGTMVSLIFALNLLPPFPTPQTYCALGPSRGAVLEGTPFLGGVPAPWGMAFPEEPPSICPGLGEGLQIGVCRTHSGLTASTVSLGQRLYPHFPPGLHLDPSLTAPCFVCLSLGLLRSCVSLWRWPPVFPGPSPSPFLMPIYALVPAGSPPSSRPRFIGP